MSLWRVPAYLDYVHPSLTPAVVQAAQSQLGVLLPTRYLTMLEEQNGGYLRATWPELPHSRIDGIGPGFPSILRDPWWRGPDADPEVWAPPEPDLLVSFDGDGHWDLCLDYRAHGPEAEPSVTYIDNETEQNLAVAESFASFLDGLVDKVEQTAIRIYKDIDLDTAAGKLATASRGEVTDRGDWNHGYRQLMVTVGPGLVWVSQNLVPAGFRRDGEKVVTTSRQALRLPDDPACRLIVEFTDDAAESAQQAIRNAGLSPKEPASNAGGRAAERLGLAGSPPGQGGEPG